MPTMRLAALLATLALAAAPAAALAQQDPFGGLPQAQSTPTEVVVNPPAQGSGGLKGWQEALIFGAGVILIAGIAWAIVSDARHRAPVADAELAHPGMGAPRPNRSPQAKARARQKAKQARKQRRRARGR
jgi:hypothetical protein